MIPKPACLGEQHASAFQEVSVASAYQYRPPYPPATFEVLAGLIADVPRYVLDAGCGTGAIARHLVEFADRVDAVDVSRAMIDQGKSLPRGDHPHLTWITGRVEDVSLAPPYALITTGDSLHWMDWYAVMPRFARLLTANGYLAILGVGQLPPPWDADLKPIIQRYSTIKNFQPYDVVEEVERRGLFRRVGTRYLGPFPFTQSLDAYIESFHGRAACSRERMSRDDAAAFDAQVRALISGWGQDVELQLVTEVVWGKALNPATPVAG